MNRPPFLIFLATLFYIIASFVVIVLVVEIRTMIILTVNAGSSSIRLTAFVKKGSRMEKPAAVRRLILEDMHWLGITLDFQANNVIIGKEGWVSSPESKTDVWVIPVDEASVLAREAIGVMNKT